MSKEQGFSRRAIYLSPLSTSADGVCALRCYLKHYGYLLQKHDTSKDTFDKDLEEGLKKFQGYYGLQTSGKLDGPTRDCSLEVAVALQMPPLDLRWRQISPIPGAQRH
jgi:murein L,D-transpeptidase YcbB/YkuD